MSPEFRVHHPELHDLHPQPWSNVRCPPCRPLEIIAQGKIDIVVLVELPQEGGLLLAAENIGPQRGSEFVREFIGYLGLDEIVVVRWAVKGEQGEVQGLVQEELLQAQGYGIPVFPGRGESGRQRVQQGLIVGDALAIVLEAQGEVLANLALIADEEPGLGVGNDGIVAGLILP